MAETTVIEHPGSLARQTIGSRGSIWPIILLISGSILTVAWLAVLLWGAGQVLNTVLGML